MRLNWKYYFESFSEMQSNINILQSFMEVYFFVLADDPAILMNNTTFSNVVSNALIIIKNV